MDKVEILINKREKLVDQIEEDYLKKLDQTLEQIEKEIISLVQATPVRSGVIYDTTFAMTARVKFKNIIEKHFNKWADETVRQYDKLAKLIDDNMKALPGYVAITREDIEKITNLKRLKYAGLIQLSNETANTLATNFYQATVSNRTFADVVKDLQLKIQGVYMKADTGEINDLVSYVKSLNVNDPKRDQALNKLHTLYGADAAGRSMRKYAKTLAHKSLKEFDGQTSLLRAKSAGLTHFLYYGDLIGDSRDFCRRHVGQKYSEEQLKEIWAGSWTGKSGSDPHLDVGGYNCRHHLQPISLDWYEDDELII